MAITANQIPMPIRSTRASFDQLNNACSGVGVLSSIRLGPKCLSALPCPPPDLKYLGENRPPRYPFTPAASTMAGNGRLKAKMPTKASAEIDQRTLFFKTLDPMLSLIHI